MRLNAYDIFIAYVSWSNGGKSRPVLILEQSGNDSVVAFNITTKYKNKSEIVRSRFFEIVDWQQAGLTQQSYVDVNKAINISLSAVDTDNLIGKLSKSDIYRLLEFLDS